MRVTLCVLVLILWSSLAQATTLPTLPTELSSAITTYPSITGNTYNATCGTFQAQLNAAAAANTALNHQVILATGTTCTGPYVLPSHIGTGWIVVRGPNLASLPPQGTRVSPSDTALMPRVIGHDLQNSGGIVFNAATGANRYRFVGLEVRENPAEDNGTNNWIQLGRRSDLANPATNTGYFVFDRMVIRDTTASHNSGRAISAWQDNGVFAMLDSYCAGIKASGKEVQCFQADTNRGPILLQNNFLEAAGENTMLCGGIDPNADADLPRDVVFRRNTYQINAAWINTELQAGHYVVKSLFELKCGVRVLVEGNTFENAGWDGVGFSFRLTVRNIFGGGTFSDISDLTIRYNLIRHVTNWIQFLPNDDQGASFPTNHMKRILIEHNLVYDLGWSCQSGGVCGSLYRISSGGNTSGGVSSSGCSDPNPNCKIDDLTIRHNTVDDINVAELCVMQVGPSPRINVNLDYRDNLVNRNNGSGVYDCNVNNLKGTNKLTEAWPGPTWTWVNNIHAWNTSGSGGSGESFASYPQGNGNQYFANASSFLWVSKAARDYTLQAGSPALNTASDNTNVGVNFVLYNAARAGAGPPPDTTPPAIPLNLTVVP